MVSTLDEASSQQQDRDQSPHIIVKNLRKTFADGTVVACENINLEIGKNEFIVFVGPSGCGKTTTLRCISGLDTPDSGQIFIQNEEVTNAKPKDRDVAFVFQNITLFPHMTVRENIRFGLDMMTSFTTKEKEEKIKEVAEMLGIENLLNRQPEELSGGQQQRVSLGRAMIMNPSAFLLDEPFSALDANLRDKMRVEVKKLQQKLKKSMIFVTHDQEEAMTLGDRIIVMNDGHIQQIGTPYEIYNKPTNQFVAQFIGSPSTNLINCTVRNTGQKVTLVSDLFEVPLPEARVEQFEGRDGAPVVLGVRPEHLRLEETGLFNATIQVIEPHGSQDVIYLTASDRELTAVTDAGKVTDPNTETEIVIDLENIWLFDKTGERVF